MLKITLLLCFLTLKIFSSPTTLYEVEPNNTPVEATPFSGEIQLTGLIKKGDQDAFMWKIGKEDSLYAWDIELVGVPNAMTRIDIMKVVFTADGKEVEDYTKFFSFGTRTGAKPVHLRNLIFAKGEYLIALSSKSKNGNAQEQSYQIRVIRKRKIYYDDMQKSSKEEAKDVRLYDSYNNDLYHYKFKESSGWFNFEINKENSQKLLTIRGISSIENEAKATLLDEENNEIVQTKTNRFGKFKISDLELDEGKYYLHYEGEHKGLDCGITVYSTGKQKIDESEIEPNNNRDEANAINYRKTIHGIKKIDDDYDYFNFSIPKKLEDKSFDIVLESEFKDLKFHLYDSRDVELQEKSSDNNYTMKNLLLNSDETYTLLVNRYSDKKDVDYSFKFSEFRDHNLSFEAEPNDDTKHAYAVKIEEKIDGYFQGDEYDCFSFNIDKPNSLWSITAKGEKLGQIELFKGLSTKLFRISKDKGSELTFKNLMLLPGNYRTCLRGKNGAYSFLVNETKLADLNISSLADIEHELNQNESQTNELKFGQTIKGSVPYGDEDYFHFTLKNYEHIRLTATPPKDGDVRFKVNSDLISISSRPKVGEIAQIEGIYPPGRYIVDLWSDKPNYGLYSLKLERLNPFTSMDIEPNDNYITARPLPNSFNIKGLISSGDEDYFKLPSYMTKETNVTISGKNIEGNIYFYPNKKDSSLSLKRNDENKTYTTTLKTPSSSYVVIERDAGFYDYNLSFTGYEPKILKELPLSLHLNIEKSEVATYSESGQKVNFTVDIESKKDIELNVTSHISDNTWRLNAPKTVALKSNEKKSLSFELVAPKNIGKTPVVTTLKFANKRGEFKTISFKIEPKDNAKALNPYEDWGMPDSILGGLNVARLDFGAKRVIEHNETEEGYARGIMVREHRLFDDFTYKGSGFHLYSQRKAVDENVTIELAGEKPSEIVGVILNPVGENSKGEQLKDFSISLSEDGKEYKHLYSGTLGLESKDQAFVFDKPYRAKYARLTLHNNHNNETNGEIGLGEWKVVAKQTSVEGLKAFNIANPKFGGHIVKSSHQLSAYWDRAILTSKAVSDQVYVYKEDKVLSWVVGFKNERIAKITNMRWLEQKDVNKEKCMKNIKVLISTETPNGPWREMSEWKKGDANQSSYSFEEPTWARYVKFVFPIEKKAYYALPEELQIFESKVGTDYKSILGEWEYKNHRSFYEYQQAKVDKPMEVITDNESKEKAFALENNQTIQGRVSVANHKEDWYKVVVPKGHNQFKLTLSGKDSVDVSYELFDSNGSQVEANNALKLPLKHLYTFDVNEGVYYLKVKQPPISVVFAWDNSGSVSPYHIQIFNAVNNYTQTIQEKIDAVNLLCFNRKDRFILQDFSDKPTQIQTIFNNFDRDCDDSDAERPLRVSSDKLKNRDGTKGVIIIGDAVGDRDIKLWKMLEDVKPKVFSIRVQSQYSDNEVYEGIMQSWSRVNNGTYNVVSNGEELYRAINRASAILRRPVYYKVNVQSNYVRPLGDGSLSVIIDPNKKVKVNKNFAIELILDASGSMLKRIKGKRRIAIARDVLKKAVKEIIPPKTQIALRVFGHKKADSCRTDLEMRLQPLNVKKTTRVISKINAKNLAKTPIADSLAKVADDLSKVKGKKVVILVTDGEETCDGDPAKEIQTLKDKGVDVRINIVGFAIDDEALKAQFKEWARLGDGGYFEANDKKSLNEAVKKALQVPYRVYNKKDELVGSGVVGSDEIKLKGGRYKVVVESYPEQVFEEVVVVGEQKKQIILKDEK